MLFLFYHHRFYHIIILKKLAYFLKRERNGMDLDGKGGDEEPGGAEGERGNCNRVILRKRKNLFSIKRANS